jgi:hypothetical protein
MKLALKRLQVYLKLVAILAVIAAVLIIILMNQEHTADIWFFGKYEDVNVLWLILITSVSSILGWWGIRKIFGVMRELAEVRRLAQADRQLSEQRRLAQELAEREKRIDQKIGESIRQVPEEPPYSKAPPKQNS